MGALFSEAQMFTKNFDGIRVSSKWDYLDLAGPTGITGSPEALWKFNGDTGDLKDRTDNGHDLTMYSGVKRYINEQGLIGLHLDADGGLSCASTTLYTLNDVTVEMIVANNAIPLVTNRAFFSCGDFSSATEAENAVYHLGVTFDTNNLRTTQEHGAGVDSTLDLVNAPPYGLSLIQYVRDKDGVSVKVYVNGVLHCSGTVGAAATGGSSTSFFIGYDGVNNGLFSIFSMRVWRNIKFTAAQCLEVYKQVAGF